MATLIHMPEIAADGGFVVIKEWLKKEGETVAVGDTLAGIETDKALIDLDAEAAGVLAKILIPAGGEAKAGTPVAVLLAPGETTFDLRTLTAGAGLPAVAASYPVQEASAMPQAQSPVPASAEVSRVLASPLARRLAKERGVDLSGLRGSGPHGRIVRRDVEGAPQATGSTVAPKTGVIPAVPATGAPYEDIPHSSMRRTIARRLSESKASIPHFYLTADCRMDRLLDLRAQANAGAPRKLSVNDFIVKAVAAALRETPEMNVSWTENALRRYAQADISVAVSTDNGLITPVVRAADSKPLSVISREIADLAARARSGRLAPDEYQGGSFTISNLGMFGVQEFSAIINPPQAAILAVGATRQCPVVVDGALAVASVMTITLSVDHRAIDGALAAQWLSTLKRMIENPLAILI